jgi:hypothetical protein
MTTQELQKAITESKFSARYNNVSIILNFPYLNYKNELKGLSTIYEFASSQIAAFNDPRFKPLNSISSNSKNYFNRFVDEIKKFKISSQNVSDYEIKALERNLIQFASEVRNYSPFIYNCPEVEFLLDIKTRYTNAVYESAYNYILENSVNFNSRDSFVGYQLAFNYFNKDNADLKRFELDKKVITESRKFFEKYLSESEGQINQFLGDTKAKYDKYILHLQEFKDEKEITFKTWFDKSNEEYSAFYKQVNDQIESFNKSSTAKISTLENTYEELLRLKKPAEYWRLRAEDLKKQGWRSLKWLIALVVFTATMLFVLLWLTPDDMLVTIFSEDKSKAIRWSIVFLAFLSVLIYGIRTLNKVTFSSFHLARDAEEREQLTHVYLSLINEKAMDKEDRLLIMQSLFSRADTGLLKEDSSPSMPGATSVIEKLVK